MEYLGNIIAVTVDELTRTKDGPAVMTYTNYKQLSWKGQINVIRPGKGLDHPALIEYASLPTRFKEKFIAKYGDPEDMLNRDKDALKMDVEARKFFEDFELDNGSHIKSEKIEEYVINASVLNRLIELSNLQRSRRNMSGNKTPLCWDAIYSVCEDLRSKYNHTLPKNTARLREKMRQYQAGGYECLVSGKLTNGNAVKITPEAGRQIIALKRCKTPVYTNQQLFDKFNELAASKGWKPLKSVGALVAFLNRPEIEIQWKDAQLGDKAAKMLYARQNSTILPTLRDALWYGDGTKLNLYYKAFVNGKWSLASVQVFEVIDASSEVLLGYNISNVENFESMYEAYRNAVEFAGHLPVELVFDNQGGTKRADASEWIKKIAKLSRPTQPYNGPSKTIENIFSRFQSQVLHQFWFFTGGNVTTKSDRSKADLDFVMANIQNLPTYQELITLYPKLRDQWNKMLHPKHLVPRMDYYMSTVNDQATVLNDSVKRDLFWVTSQRPCTFSAYGLQITVKGEKYQYEVFGQDGMPDLDWRAKNTGRQFYVSYDPRDMKTVRLYTKDDYGYQFVTEAKPYVQIHRALQDQTEEERSFIRKMEEAVKQDRVKRQLESVALEQEFGVAPEQNGLNRPGLKGISGKTFERLADSLAQAPSEVYPASVGQMDKAISNMTYDEAAALDRL